MELKRKFSGEEIQMNRKTKKLIFRNLSHYYPNQNDHGQNTQAINKDVGQREHMYIVDRTVV